MPLRPRSCPRCRGDMHLTTERPSNWQCLQCGHRQPVVDYSQRAVWQRLIDEMVEMAEP